MTLSIDLQLPPPIDATWGNCQEYVTETRFRFHKAYEQAHKYLQFQQKRQYALYKAKVHGSKCRQAKKYSCIRYQLPQGSVLSFIILGAVPTKSHKSSAKWLTKVMR